MAIDDKFIDRVKNLYGASNTNLKNLDSGALASLLSTERQPLDPALISLIGFSEMAKQASQPGATALGSFGAGVEKGATTKLASDLADRKTDATDRSNVLTFLGKLAKPKTTTMKTQGTGQALNYMTEETAKKFLSDRGVTPDIAGYNDFIKLVTIDDENLIGTPVVFAGKPMEFNFVSEGNEIKSIVTNQIKGAPTDSNYVTKQKKIENINKNDKTISNMTTLFPRLTQAKNILLNPEVETGFGQTEGFLVLKQGLKTLFGFTDNDLADQQIIQSLSFQLAPLMRPPGSGSTSDMEFKAYQKGILSLGNEKKANYLNLYTLQKMTENGIKLGNLELELLSSPKNYSYKYIKDKIVNSDIGIFKKIYKDDNKQNRLYDDDGTAKFDDNEEKKAIIKSYVKNLARGDVFMNDDGKGNQLFEGLGTYIVKGLDLPANFGDN